MDGPEHTSNGSPPQVVPDGGATDADSGTPEQDAGGSSTPPTDSAGASLESKVLVATASAGAGLFGFGLIAVVANLLFGPVSALVDAPTEVEQLLVGTLAIGPGAVAAAWLYLSITDRDLDFIDVRTPSLRDLGYVVVGIVGLIGVLYAGSLLLNLLGATSSEHGAVGTARGNPALLLVLITLSILLIGPGEELLFRNIVQKPLYDAFSRPAAIGIASVVFALVHFSAYSTGTTGQVLLSLAMVFVLSLVLGGIYALTDNLVVPALAHGVFNAIQFAALYFQEAGGL